MCIYAYISVKFQCCFLYLLRSEAILQTSHVKEIPGKHMSSKGASLAPPVSTGFHPQSLGLTGRVNAFFMCSSPQHLLIRIFINLGGQS